MKKDTFVTEDISGVTVEYLSEFHPKPLPPGCGIIMLPPKLNGAPVDLEKLLKGYGQQVAPKAAELGYKRVQIGSLGDMSYYGYTKGKFLPLDTMYVARLLKR